MSLFAPIIGTPISKTRPSPRTTATTHNDDGTGLTERCAPSLPGKPETQHLRRLLRSPWLALFAIVGLLGTVVPTADAARLGIREAGTGATTVDAIEGQSVSMELFLDTEGLSFEGYLVGIDITGGTVNGLSITHQPLTGLFPDLFGAPVVDDADGTVRNDGQTTFTTGLAAGTYVLDIIAFTVGTYGPGDEIVLTPGLFGEVLGLGGGSCPGTAGGCSVTIESARVIPEPGTALLVGLGLLGLSLSSEGRRGPSA